MSSLEDQLSKIFPELIQENPTPMRSAQPGPVAKPHSHSSERAGPFAKPTRKPIGAKRPDTTDVARGKAQQHREPKHRPSSADNRLVQKQLQKPATPKKIARPQSKQSKPAATQAQQAKTKTPQPTVKKPEPIRQTAVVTDKLIAGLPHRTMDELRGQWLNAIRYPPEYTAVAEFRQALLKEWERRARNARTPADYFRWPSTKGGSGDGGLKFDSWNEQGMLKFFGYQVGVTNGQSDQARRHILDAIFSVTLPPVNDAQYTFGWGRPETPARLRRLAEELARFVRNAKAKKAANMAVAISEWEADLSYLYGKYYKSWFGFDWP